MMQPRLTGLIAAACTPFHQDGSLNLAQVGPVVQHLLRQGVSGLYVCGSTGEGVSLTREERMAVAEAYVREADGVFPVIVQVGHNSLHESRSLAAHAQQIGASGVSANAPSYFKVSTVGLLVDCVEEMAAGAPRLPFYYYHIPQLTGAHVDMVAFLQEASGRVPNLAGLKYTAPTLHEFQRCLELDDGRYDVLWGVDEMLLAAVATGARAAVGSTYNIAAPVYLRMMEAFASGDSQKARKLQSQAVGLVALLAKYPFLPAVKATLRMLGLDVGACRLPLPRLDGQASEDLRRELEAASFFEELS